MSEERDQLDAPEELDSTAAEGVAAEAESQSDDQTADTEEADQEDGQAEDDSEEIEHEGAKYRVPKAIKPLLMFQQDYTRKTQEVAEARRTVEAERAAIAQQAELHELTLEERATIKLVDQQLAAYRETDWDTYAWNNRTENDPYGTLAVQKALAHKAQLETAKGDLQSEITRKQEEHRLESERRSATALQEADAALRSEFKDFGPELVQNVAKVAQSVGFTAAELRESLVGADGKADTRSFKVLARLHAAETELAALKSKQTKAQTAERQAAVTPAKTVGAKAGQYKAGLADDLPIEEWTRRRQAQLKRA